jgi:hypothetical protein
VPVPLAPKINVEPCKHLVPKKSKLDILTMGATRKKNKSKTSPMLFIVWVKIPSLLQAVLRFLLITQTILISMGEGKENMSLAL